MLAGVSFCWLELDRRDQTRSYVELSEELSNSIVENRPTKSSSISNTEYVVLAHRDTSIFLSLEEKLWYSGISKFEESAKDMICSSQRTECS